MSRRRQATKKPLAEDAKFHSPLVTRLVNTVMICGKKSLAQRIVYGAFDQIATKNPASSPLEILQRAVDNAKPRLEVKARRVGGATYQVPVEVPTDRSLSFMIPLIEDCYVHYNAKRSGGKSNFQHGGRGITRRILSQINLTEFSSSIHIPLRPPHPGQ